jgi:ABC-type nitrate/sulfonate/bicarbonate transport system permease component
VAGLRGERIAPPALAGAAARLAAPWLSPVLLAAAWEGLARARLVTPFMLPAPSAVLARILADAASGELARDAGLTLYRTLAGFGIAAAAGIVLGVLTARNRAVRWFMDPLVSAGFPMPKIAFLPIVTLWLGFHDASKIAMIVFDAAFPVLAATIAGAAGVARELVWSARNLGASEREVTWEVIVPAALPRILTGLQVSLPIALIVCVIAEMAGGSSGLGGAMLSASRFADSPGTFAGIVEIAALGTVLVRAIAAVRRRLLAWHPEALEAGMA